MSSIQTWNSISWTNRIICRLYSWSQEHHSCSSKLKKRPSSITELWNILGLVGFFRRSIPNFSLTPSPLYHILTDTQNKQRHSKEPIDWHDHHQAALEKLLHHIATPPILAYPDYSQPFISLTDGSRLGLVCSLFQMQNGKLRVLGFGSSTLVGAEKNISFKLGFLVLKWASEVSSVWEFPRLFISCTTFGFLHRL